MKKFKKLVAVMLAAIMVMAMGTSVFAASTNYKITITNANDSTTHSYSAYQIFTGTSSGSEGSYTLSDIDWATGMMSIVLAAIQSDNDLMTAFSVGNQTTTIDASTIATALSTADSDVVEAFAKAVATKIASNGTVATATSTNNQDGTYTIDVTSAGAGYYLIVDDNSGATSGENAESYSAYMLKVVGGENKLTTKDEAPTVEKTITSSTTMIGSSGQISTAAGDSKVSYQIVSKVPDMTGYETYTFIITDNLSKGLTLQDGTLKIAFGTNASSEIISETDYDSLVDKSSTYCYYTYAPTAGSGLTDGSEATTITITFTEYFLKAWEAGTLTTGEAIKITYDATLVAAYANTGSTANTNEVSLTYSNDPNGSTSSTVKSTTQTYTTTITVKKVDSTGNYVAGLEGATFVLSSTGTTSISDQILVIDDSNGKTTAIDLSAGTYKLSETVTPAGYNSVDDFEFTLSCSDSGVWSISGSENGYGVTLDGNGNIVITVTNTSGVKLAETGGMGTTILYIIGAILVIGAAVLLITRRRMANR